MQLKTFRISDIAHKTVLMRVDYNVPLTSDGQVADDRRLQISLEDLRFMLLHQAKVVLISHLGRPKGIDPKYSLKPIAEYLEKKFKIPTAFVPEVVGTQATAAVKSLKPGHVLLLENLRFHPGEKTNDPEFAQALAGLADVYINNAFSAAHRAHASTVGVTHYLPALAGSALASEVYSLSEMMDSPGKPFVILLGGAKISDKVGAIKHLASLASIVLVGGAVANNFLKADGLETHHSYIEETQADLKKVGTDFVKFAGQLMRKYKTERMLKDGFLPLPKILYPVDVLAAPVLDTSDPEQVEVIDLTHDMQDTPNDRDLLYLDIGPKTTKLYREILSEARTVFWNGPMGVWENPLFAKGTQGVAKTIADNPHTTVLGGGDTIAAVRHFKLESRYKYISAAGGASLDFLGGKMLPGIKPLLLAE
jgi:3-phosphoglycerate kinase